MIRPSCSYNDKFINLSQGLRFWELLLFSQTFNSHIFLSLSLAFSCFIYISMWRLVCRRERRFRYDNLSNRTHVSPETPLDSIREWSSDLVNQVFILAPHELIHCTTFVTTMRWYIILVDARAITGPCR